MVVAVIAIITTTLSILHVLLGWAKTPANTQYMWTGHYYLDYFYYLQFIAQGLYGNLIAHQYFATGDNSLYIHLYPYLFIGYLAKLLHMSVIMAYWTSVCLFIFSIVFLMYAVIKNILKNQPFAIHICTLLFAIYAAPFFTILNIDGKKQIGLYDFWFSGSTLFNRFEPIPHHLLSIIGMLISFLLVEKIFDNNSEFSVWKSRNKITLLIIINALLMIFYPFGMIVFLFGLGLFYITKIVSRPTFKKNIYFTICFALTSLICLIVGYAIKQYYLHATTFTENFSSTELVFNQQISLFQLFRVIGPIALFFPFGLIGAFRNRNSLSSFYVLFTIGSIVLFFSPLNKMLGTHNARFLSPLNYITYAFLSVYGIQSISQIARKYKRLVFSILFITIFILITISTAQSFTRILQDKNIDSPISYLPKNIFTGFTFLDKQRDSKAVLTTPSQFIGQLLPVFVNKKVYIARQIATPGYESKASEADAFFRSSLTANNASTLLRDNGIGYVVLTSLEGYVATDDFRTYDFSGQLYKTYPFLSEIYKNKDIVIFKVKSH